ncbi:MAG TPA: metallophosphoesterase [Candidatus Limnocylindrales bacterium]|nr:metallophosphoesterase [Candidatus Limnocylindrales bacterium]
MLLARLAPPGGRPSPGGPAATFAVAPATAGPGSVVFVGAGDIATCTGLGDERTAAILDVVPGTVFTLGDNAYNEGSKAEFDRCYGPTWGRQLDRTKPSPGNHEYGTRGAAGYFSYFGARAGEGARGWYAYDDGSWRIYSLNSNCGEIGGCGEGSAELTWLRDDLAAHPSRCALAYWHHPRFSSGEHGDNALVGPLWDTLADAGTELVLAGHDHDYERFAPLRADGALDEAGGMTSFVVGTGGKELRTFERAAPNSLVRNADTWGVLQLVLSPGGWSSLFLPVAGAGFTDRAAGTCH